jgi:hypothetical protein
MISTNVTRAHLRILETLPRERIRTHTRPEAPPDEREAAKQRQQLGVPVEITREMLMHFAQMKRSGARYIEIKHSLRVSVRTMARLRDKAMQERLIEPAGGPAK